MNCFYLIQFMQSCSKSVRKCNKKETVLIKEDDEKEENNSKPDQMI